MKGSDIPPLPLIPSFGTIGAVGLIAISALAIAFGSMLVYLTFFRNLPLAKQGVGEWVEYLRELYLGFYIMPKIKTKRAAAKRFRILSSGKIKRNHANKRHILTKKNRARLNKLKKPAYVVPADVGLVLRCLPNG